VRTTEADNQKLREAFRTSVLPAWLQRCGDTCVPVWNRLMAPIVGIRATPPPNKP
jgi:TRAP-type transport system periplasmic protein